MILSTTPLSPADLERLRTIVARAWPARAEAQGIRCESDVHMGLQDGAVVMMARAWGSGPCPKGAPVRALEGLARALEDLGYAIERRGAARIVAGWATVACPWEHGGACLWCADTGRLRVADLDPGEDPRRSYDRRLFDERARLDAERLDKASHPRGPKYEGAVRRGRAAGGR